MGAERNGYYVRIEVSLVPSASSIGAGARVVEQAQWPECDPYLAHTIRFPVLAGPASVSEVVALSLETAARTARELGGLSVNDDQKG